MVASLPRQMRIELLTERWNELRRNAFSYTPLDMELTSAAVEILYASIGLEPPMIFWCKSPIQVLLMPMAVQCVLRSDNLWRKMDTLSDYGLSSTWRQLWANLANHLAQSTSRNAPLRSSKDSFWTTIDDLLEAQIKAMSLRHAVECALLVQDTCFNTLSDHFEKTIRRQTQNFAAPQINSFMLQSDAVIQTPEELVHHLALSEEIEIFEALYQHIPTHKETARLRAPYQNVRRALRPMTAHTNNLWWGPLTRAAGEWEMLFHAILNESFVPPNLEDPSYTFFRAWMTIMRQSMCCAFYPDAAFVCEKRGIHVDDRGMLHHQSEASLSCADGFQMYTWHGVTVPATVITNPDALTVREIDTQRNMEVKRVMLERFGAERYLRESGAAVVNWDAYGTLLRKEINGLEPLLMVKVKNRTAEPDGTYKEYLLRVPPQIRTAKEAVAWTFGLQSEEYQPNKET